jgi:L-amino acid N-acyltransferase YncA
MPAIFECKSQILSVGVSGLTRNVGSVSFRGDMIRRANLEDLPQIVAIYNASIPGRLATADTSPVSVESRVPWFTDREARHPIWVDEAERELRGWLSLGRFYGRPAYAATTELGVYVAPHAQRQGVASALIAHALREALSLGHKTVLALVFGHNAPSVTLFEKFGFAQWGHLPRIAELDHVERDLLIYGKRIQK